MKTIASQFSKLMLIMIFIPTFCLAKESVANLTESKLANNGDIVSQSYSFVKHTFDAIELAGDFDVVAQIVHQPRTANVVIIASNNLLSHISVYVKNHTLHISKKDDWGFYPSKKIKVKITVDNLKSIKSHGSSDSYINNIKTDKFEAEIHGSGSIILQGDTKKASLDIHGSGEIKARKLVAESTKVSISGSGLIITNAIQKLNIDMNGSGTVEYYGNPHDIEQSFNGSGKIKAMK